MSTLTEIQHRSQTDNGLASHRNLPTHSRPTVTQVTDAAAVWQRKASWRELLERTALNTPFQTPEWHQSWWQAFGSGQQISFLMADVESDGRHELDGSNDGNNGNHKEEPRLVGVAPFLQSSIKLAGFTWKELSFLGGHLGSDYCDFVTDQEWPDVLPQFCAWLIEHPKEWNLLHLSKLRDDTGTLDTVVDYFRDRGFHVDVQEQYEAPSRLLNDPVEDVKLPRKKSLKRHYNYFKREGELAFVNLTSFDEIEPHLPLFFEQHIARWGETDTPSQFHSQRQKDFYYEMVKTAAEQGWLLFSVLLFNEKPIAYHLGFDYAGTITWYKPVYDIAYSKHSPGEVLLKYLLEYALAKCKDEFDFTIGSEQYKFRYANTVRHTYDVRIYQNGLAHKLDQTRLRAINAAKQSDFLLNIGRKVYDRFYSV